MLTKMQLDIEFIKFELEKLNLYCETAGRKEPNDLGENLLVPFPIKTKEDFDSFDRDLGTNSDMKAQMVSLNDKKQCVHK